ncbi:hypothetical protein G6F57_023011 [Rhizopus arrhizus]|nr:hypothetical protein G6F57_023011 [Rhizopus arrhizus]
MAANSRRIVRSDTPCVSNTSPATSTASTPRSAASAAMRATTSKRASASMAALTSYRRTSQPLRANTMAQPWPIRPVPMMAAQRAGEPVPISRASA